MVEAHGECALGGERAAEAHAAEHRELRAPLHQQARDLEEVLVPAHGDAVFRHAAESRHHAPVERLAQFGEICGWAEGHALAVGLHTGNRGVERLDLEAVDADHRVAVVHQMMRQRESRGTHADDEHALAGFRQAAAGGAGSADSSA